MRNPVINSALEVTVTRVRLTSYLIERQNNLHDALTLYELNTRLSEAFYTPLQSVEICLRNTLNTCMGNVYGADWFDNGNAPLGNEAREMIADAYRQLRNYKSRISSDAVVAELKFAFWINLMGPRYDSSLWRKSLYRGFPTGGGKPRSVVHGRFNAIRRFRNRIAHHEPIFNRGAARYHAEILEAIGWMCPYTCAWATHHSRVAIVLAGA